MRLWPFILLIPPVTVAVVLWLGAERDTPDTPPPLLDAAARGDLVQLDRLLGDQASPDVVDACFWTPLMKASLNGHIAAAQRLLGSGALIDLEDKGGYTALMLAASNDHAEIVRLLADAGAAIDHADRGEGWTALIWASKRGHVASVQTLLALGADPAIRDRRGLTAADWARREKHPAIQELLAGTRRAAP
jgi:ankyrin repeat protein